MKPIFHLVLVGLTAGALPSHAAPPTLDPDWPCQQVKVPELSVAALWAGPSIDAIASTWQNDPQVVDLVDRISQRRVPIPDAQGRIEAFAKQAGAAKQTKLLAVFAGLFDRLNTERESVIAGLSRFGARQKQLASGLRTAEESLRTAQSAATPDATKVSALSQNLAWNAQVFEQRREALGFACDVPNVIEQRLFALARTIQGLLN